MFIVGMRNIISDLAEWLPSLPCASLICPHVWREQQDSVKFSYWIWNSAEWKTTFSQKNFMSETICDKCICYHSPQIRKKEPYWDLFNSKCAGIVISAFIAQKKKMLIFTFTIARFDVLEWMDLWAVFTIQKIILRLTLLVKFLLNFQRFFN